MNSKDYRTEDISPRELLAMYTHLKEELAELRGVVYSSMPKGSPERHLMEHEIIENSRNLVLKRKEELMSHLIRTLIASVLIVLGTWAYQGGITSLANGVRTAQEVQQVEVPKK